MSIDLQKLIAEARAARDYGAFMQVVPYFRFLGLTVREGEGGPVCVLPADPKLVGNAQLPALHGGVVGALLESAAIVHLIWAADTDSIPKIIDLSVDYLRSARPVETYARAVVTKHGRRIANVRAEAWQDDPERPVAAAHAHFLLD
ncbi:MAG TPA: PaaI family thioesterase [Ferrovibrio sp.]|uniref:PaaI family thioesterase n=1 Tax=Ferrovibrio sp. TaxID=1917215 RepID=UPI002ED3D241